MNDDRRALKPELFAWLKEMPRKGALSRTLLIDEMSTLHELPPGDPGRVQFLQLLHDLPSQGVEVAVAVHDWPVTTDLMDDLGFQTQRLPPLSFQLLKAALVADEPRSRTTYSDVAVRELLRAAYPRMAMEWAHYASTQRKAGEVRVLARHVQVPIQDKVFNAIVLESFIDQLDERRLLLRLVEKPCTTKDKALVARLERLRAYAVVTRNNGVYALRPGASLTDYLIELSLKPAAEQVGSDHKPWDPPED